MIYYGTAEEVLYFDRLVGRWEQCLWEYRTRTLDEVTFRSAWLWNCVKSEDSAHVTRSQDCNTEILEHVRSHHCFVIWAIGAPEVVCR